ncbi:MAG: hypothetical protein ACLRSW_05495 [Christensenellaceae bacterium]
MMCVMSAIGVEHYCQRTCMRPSNAGAGTAELSGRAATYSTTELLCGDGAGDPAAAHILFVSMRRPSSTMQRRIKS